MSSIVGRKTIHKNKIQRDVNGVTLHGEFDVLLEVVRMAGNRPVVRWETVRTIGGQLSGEFVYPSTESNCIGAEVWMVSLIKTVPGMKGVNHANEVCYIDDGTVNKGKGI